VTAAQSRAHLRAGGLESRLEKGVPWRRHGIKVYPPVGSKTARKPQNAPPKRQRRPCQTRAGSEPHHSRVVQKRDERLLLLDALRRRLCDDAVPGDSAIDDNEVGGDHACSLHTKSRRARASPGRKGRQQDLRLCHPDLANHLDTPRHRRCPGVDMGFFHVPNLTWGRDFEVPVQQRQQAKPASHNLGSRVPPPSFFQGAAAVLSQVRVAPEEARDPAAAGRQIAVEKGASSRLPLRRHLGQVVTTNIAERLGGQSSANRSVDDEVLHEQGILLGRRKRLGTAPAAHSSV